MLLRCFFCASLLLSFTLVAHGQAFSDPDLSAPTWKSFEEASEEAKAEEQVLMVDVYADWCGWCRRLEREVYADEEVQDYLDANFATTRLDFDNAEDSVSFEGDSFTMQQMAHLLGAQGVPTVAFLTSSGQYITHVPGFVERDDFLNVLRFVSTGAYREQTWEEFMADRDE